MLNRKDGFFVKLSNEVIVYRDKEKILESIYIQETNGIEIINEKFNPDGNVQITLAKLKTKKEAIKALKNIAHEKFYLPQFFIYGATIVFCLLLGTQLATKTIIPVQQGVSPMALKEMMNDNDFPSGMSALPPSGSMGVLPQNIPNMPTMAYQQPIVKESPQQKEFNSKVISNISAYEDAVKNGKPITKEMLDGLPPEVSALAKISLSIKEHKKITPEMLENLPESMKEKIKEVANNSNFYHESTEYKAKEASNNGGALLGTHKISSNPVLKEEDPMDVLSMKKGELNTQEQSNTQEETKVQEQPKAQDKKEDEKLKELENKKKLFDDALHTDKGLKPVTSDYKNYEDFKKDYPETPNK